MRYLTLGLVVGIACALLWPTFSGVDDANTREVGVEWVNQYHGFAGELSACDDDAVGFYDTMGARGFTKSFNWGNDNAWEQDFKSPEKPGGGTDTSYADNVDFVYFSGHGNTDGFYFGTTIDDHQVHYNDAVWGDKDLDFITLSACQTLNYAGGAVWGRFGWPIFRGLHMLCGMHTNMSDTPDAGRYFANYMTGNWAFPGWGAKYTVCQSWRWACWWALPAGQYCAIMGATGAGGDTWNDYAPGYGPMAPDPYPISYLWYINYPCG